MNQDERRIIDELFAKLHQVEASSEPRDAAAEALIRRHVESQPAAPYYMAQAIVAQQEALARAQARIGDLEQQVRERPSGGFLGSLFGGGESERRGGASRLPSVPTTGAGERAPARGRAGPWSQPYGAGGSFLGGAMQTALGVAGGVLIADALAGLLSPDEAAAAEPAPEAGSDAEFGADDDLGDFADMDFGGDEF